MKVTTSAISLNVDDPVASARFVGKEHFGFVEEMAADGFVSLARPDVGFNLIFLQTGLASFTRNIYAAGTRTACSSYLSWTTSTASISASSIPASRLRRQSRRSRGASGTFR